MRYRKRNVFVQNKKLSHCKFKIAMLVFAVLAFTFIINAVINAQKPIEEISTPNTSLVTEEHPITLNNNFQGLINYQENGNNIKQLNFGNLEASNVRVTETPDQIIIEVDQVENASEYANTSFLSNNISLEQRGEVLVFKIDKGGIERRYLIQQHEQSIKLKLLAPGLEGKRITIDPGHGGPDGGAVGPTGLLEKEVALDISLILRDLLEEAGADVLLTRDSDQRPYPGTYNEDLFMRVEFAYQFDSDMFISIHNNSIANPTVRGIETLYRKNTVNSLQSKELAQIVQNNLVNKLGGRDRGLVDRDSGLLRGQNFVSVLPEILFISNPEEEKMMKQPDFAQNAAESLFNAIKEYYGN